MDVPTRWSKSKSSSLSLETHETVPEKIDDECKEQRKNSSNYDVNDLLWYNLIVIIFGGIWFHEIFSRLICYWYRISLSFVKKMLLLVVNRFWNPFRRTIIRREIFWEFGYLENIEKISLYAIKNWLPWFVTS